LRAVKIENSPIKFPLTRGQEAMWFEYKINPNATSYNTLVQLKLEGNLDAKKFCQAASDVVGYFDMLRSYFTSKEGKVFLSFSDEEYCFEFIDLSNEKKNQQKLDQALDEKRSAAIDLTKFPLISSALIKSSKNTFYFTGVVPHIISDGASALFFLNALSVTYNEGLAALKSKFDDSKKTWPEYLDYLFKEKQEKNQDLAFKYWQKNLTDASHRLEFGNANKNKQSTNIGRRESFSVSDEAFKKMKKLAFANRTSIFSVLAAFFSAFLNRFYAANDLIIGYPVNLRPAGFRNAFGFFVNILPLRMQLDENLSLNELVKKADKQRRADKKFQYLNSLDIIKARRKTDLNFDGLMFNISMVETISRLQNLTLKNIKSTSMDNEKIEIHDDLSFIYELGEGGIKLWLEYREDLFSEKAIKIMVKTFQKLIEASVFNPDQKLSTFNLLDAKEENLILKDFNKVNNITNPPNIHQMFEKKAG
jgi:hypothetical protein